MDYIAEQLEILESQRRLLEEEWLPRLSGQDFDNGLKARAALNKLIEHVSLRGHTARLKIYQEEWQRLFKEARKCWDEMRPKEFVAWLNTQRQ